MADIDPLFVDIYAEDFNGKPDIAALVNAGPPWHGLIIKASEGTYYPHNRPYDRAWVERTWGAIEKAAGDRLGVDFFRGAYHYMRLDEDPKAQAENFLTTLYASAKMRPTDLLMVDVERAENPAPDSHKILEYVRYFSRVVYANTGIDPILYGGEYLRASGIKDHLGCRGLITANYGATLPASSYQAMGWDIVKPGDGPGLLGWQYSGAPDGGKLAGYPTTCPLGAGPADITVLVAKGDPRAWFKHLADGVQP